jgi:hypothetical protein
MPTKFKIVAFDVVRCGYFHRGSPQPEFGGLSAILEDLSQWVAGKEMRDTMMSPVEGEDDATIYCFGILANEKRRVWLLTTWNGTHDEGEQLQAARASAQVGEVDVSLNTVEDGYIVGYPSYFLFVPELDLVFAVRPEGQRRNGHAGMVRFLRGFLTNSSSFVVLKDGDDIDPDVDNDVAGYRDGAEGEPLPLLPSFVSRPRRLPGEIEYLRERREAIRQVVRRDRLHVLIEKDRDLVGKLLQNIGLIEADTAFQELRFGYQLEFTPTEDEFEAIVAGAHDDFDGEIGFVLTAESQPRWLDHAWAKDDLELDVAHDDNRVFDAEQLLAQLQARGADLLQLAKVNIEQP